MNGNVEEINDDENLSLTEEQQEKLKQVTEEFLKKARENSESIKNILQVIPNYGVSVTQELIEAGKKFKIRYEEKERLWEQDRNYYKNKGFDREFQEMLFELAKLNPEINRKAIGQIFGMKKGEFRDLFDDWFVRYEAERDRKLAEKRKLVTNTSTDTNEGKKITLTHAQISLLYIYTKREINKNNAQEIAEQYKQTSGQKLADTYRKMVKSLSERISSRFAVRDIERVIKLLSEQSLLNRANDELKQAKKLKGVD